MNTSNTSVLLVGLAASVVDFEKWPHLSVEKLEAGFLEVKEQVEALGYQANWCLIESADTAEAQLRESIARQAPDIVLIGAGVRTDPDYFSLFEKLINVIHVEAPSCRIAFNSKPGDSIEAIQRWI